MGTGKTNFFNKWRNALKSPGQIAALKIEMDTIKSRMDVPAGLTDRFFTDRSSGAYLAVYEKEEPLVTVCIATFNRGSLLLERSVRSVLEQSYRNIELIVVGDCCTDDTASRMASVTDPRLHFVNLPERGKYPEDPFSRWCVAGTVPINHALSMASGDFITHLDDDDAFDPARIEMLVNVIRRERADLVWHPYWFERPDGSWRLNEAGEFAWGLVTTSSILYHHWFVRLPWDIEAYRLREPGDWNRLRKFRYLGAKVVRCPEPLLRHFRERNRTDTVC